MNAPTFSWASQQQADDGQHGHHSDQPEEEDGQHPGQLLHPEPPVFSVLRREGAPDPALGLRVESILEASSNAVAPRGRDTGRWLVVLISELKFSLRVFARTYPWRKVDGAPGAKLRSPIDRCRVALVSTAGMVVPGDEPFDQDVRGGDFSHRVIPADADVRSLEEHHRSDAFDHSGLEADRNIVLPLDRLHELAANGEIG